MAFSLKAFFPNPNQIAAAYKDWIDFPTRFQKELATEAVIQAAAYTPYDTGATAHPEIRVEGKNNVVVDYNATNWRGDYYAKWVNLGVGWRGQPVQHYTHHGGPGFIEKMSSKSNLERIVRENAIGISAMIPGPIFNNVRATKDGQTVWVYQRPKVMKSRKYEQYGGK